MTADGLTLKPYVSSSDRDELINAAHISKKFCKNLKRSMAHGIADLSKNLVGIKPNSAHLRKDEFWAVDNVSFKLNRGDVLGLIGPNGSGKSTLLRLLAGIFPPDIGEISIKGRVGALIAVGAGFHPHLTGRENIYLNGAILGMTSREIDAKFADIVDFAEIEDFLDAPVSTYSSGMRVRLGFAIAIQIEPDVLLIDEILAVGDVGFRGKCINAIDRITKNAAVIFVSHNMSSIARICSKIMVLHNSKEVYQGENVALGIEHYYSLMGDVKSSISGSGRASIEDVKVYAANGQNEVSSPVKLQYLDDLYMEIVFKLAPEIKRCIINIALTASDMRAVAQVYSNNCDHIIENTGDTIATRVKIPSIQFNPGIYYITINIVDDRRGELLIRHQAVRNFHVTGSFIGHAPVQLQAQWSNT